MGIRKLRKEDIKCELVRVGMRKCVWERIRNVKKKVNADAK